MNIDIQKMCSKVKIEILLLLLFSMSALAIKPAIANQLCPGSYSEKIDSLANGSEYVICVPPTPPPKLNACAIVLSHGIVDATEVVEDEDGNKKIEMVKGGKLENIEGQLNDVDGNGVIDFIELAAPCAFAVVSRKETGAFVKKEGGQLLAIQELRNLTEITKNQMVQTLGISEDEIDVFGTGISLGGLLMTLTQERTNLFEGAIPACGPYILKNQVNYQLDAIVVFDYFNFITTRLFDQNADIPTIPDEVIINWEKDDSPFDIESQIRKALLDQWDYETREFLRVLRLDKSLEQAAGKKLGNFETGKDKERDLVVRGIRDLFEDAVFNLKDSQQKLCRKKSGYCKTTGNVYSNRFRIYSGSVDDASLNRGVQRFALRSVDKHALNKFNKIYSISGDLNSPTTTLHGIGEIRIPYKRNAVPYWLKALFGGSAKLHKLIPVKEIDHCQFEPTVAFLALLDLRLRAASSP